MKVLTAYNDDVQAYFQGAKLNKINKETIIEGIKETVRKAGKSFSRMFPCKQKLVLDEIIFLLSDKGICKIGADKLAEKTGSSVRTVKSAVKSLKETGEVLVCRLADGHAGKYVFVLKSHPNFKEIMREVFFIHDIEGTLKLLEQANTPAETITENNAENDASAQQNAPQFAQHFAPLENREMLDTQGIEGEKSSSNHINQSNRIYIKQEDINDVRQAVENELIEASASNNLKKELEHINTYYVNEYQFKLYHHIKAGEYHKEIQKNASIIGLRVGTNCSEEGFLCAVKAICKIDRFIKRGGTVKSVPALFSAKYQEYMEKAEPMKEYMKQEQKLNITEEVTEVNEYQSKLIWYDWTKE
jgi:hypothetical protein